MTRVVDLSHRLIPGAQRFRLSIKQYSVDEYVPEYKVAEGEWYIMEDVEICTHVGTHVEAPFHAMKEGQKAGDLDIFCLIGMASIIDFTDKSFNMPLKLSEMIERGKHVRRGDIVLIKTGLSKYYGTVHYKRPYLETDATGWLIEKGIKCLGIDCSGIENRLDGSGEVNHRMLFSRGIPLIEDMNNLVKLTEQRVFFLALPLPIEGLDASPIRPLAIEPLEAGKELARIFLSSDVKAES